MPGERLSCLFTGNQFISQSSTFRPLWFLANPHLQTLLAHIWQGPSPRLPAILRHVPLPDGDRLAVHDSIPRRWQPAAGMAVLVHGLGGCHQSGYMVRVGSALWRSGMRVLRMDLRGVGAGETLAKRTYHGGCSDDVRAVAGFFRQQNPAAPLILVGLSLGGNIVLKLAGESAANPLPGLV